MSKSMVIMKRRSWDAMFFHDMMTGNGFIISEPPEITLDGEKKKTLYGPRSSLYGTTYEDEQAYVERYRCECGSFKSKLFEGELCPICGKEVKDRGVDLNKTGWIVLKGDNKIVNPYYFNKFVSLLGKNGKQIFTDIVFAKYEVDINGIKRRITETDGEALSSPYAGIGIEGFYDNFTEIINYFIKERKNKEKSFQIILKEKYKVFCSHVPIMTTFIRPQSASGDTLYFNTIDKAINTLFSLNEKLEYAEDIEQSYLLQRIQLKVNSIWETAFSMFHGKDGLIRNEINGGSFNYTGRSVIVLDPSLRDNEIDVSYYTFLEIFKYKIIYYLMKLEDISLGKAYDIWKDANCFSTKVYEIMNFMLSYGEIKILLNRNPTLNYYSFLLLKIRKILKDPEDFSYSLPPSILAGLNADLDGDILNLLGLTQKEVAFIFRKFDPVRRMIISKDSGYLNPYFAISKNQKIDLYHFWSLEETDNDEEEVYNTEE